jgi:hypothetical protein
MSTPREDRLPVSITNAVLIVVFLVGALVTAAVGSWFEAALLALLAAVMLGAALYARRPGSRDITRVNAIEYRDERDRRIAQAGLAAVGAVALVLSAVGFVVLAVLGGTGAPSEPLRTVVVAQFFVLAAVWGVANSLAARRW